MSDNLEGVFRRLRKLLAIAEDGRGDPAEAAAAMQQAESIMRKYQIDQGDLFIKDTVGADAFAEWDVGGTEDLMPSRPIRVTHQWARMLAIAIAKLNDCQVRFPTELDKFLGKIIRFQGLKSDVEVCKFSYRMVVNNMNMQVRRLKPDSPISFRAGYAIEVIQALHKALKEKQGLTDGTGALVVVKSDAVIKRFGEAKYGTAQIQLKDHGSFLSGQEEGRKLNAGMRGIASGNTNTVRSIR